MFCVLAFSAGVYGSTAAGLKASQMPFSKIVGQGADTAAVIFYCPSEDPYNAFLFGYLFNDNDDVYVADMMQALRDEANVLMYDDEMTSGFICNINWHNNVLGFNGAGCSGGYYWMYNINDVAAEYGINAQKLHANDVVNWQLTNDFESPLYTYEGMLADWINVYPVLDENYHPLPKLDDITFYAGVGSKHAAFVLYEPSTYHATVWGYQFEGDAMVADMLTAITAADNRLEIRGLETGWITSIAFTDDIVSFDTQSGDPYTYWMYNLNDVAAPKGISEMPLNDMDVVVMQYGGASVASIDYLNYYWMPYIADDPNFRGADLFSPVYFVGEGEAVATLSINYTPTNKALTWGYRFNPETAVMLSDMLDEIAGADPRLTIEGASTGSISEIAYNGSEATFSGTGFNWLFSINDRFAPLVASRMPVHDGAAVYFEHTGGVWPYTIKRLDAAKDIATYVSQPGTGINEINAQSTLGISGNILTANAAGRLRIYSAAGVTVLDMQVAEGQTASLDLPAGVYTALLNGKALKFVK